MEKAIEAAREEARKQTEAAENHQVSVEHSEPAGSEASLTGPSSAYNEQAGVEHSSGQSYDPGQWDHFNQQADFEHSGYRFPMTFEGSLRSVSAYSGSVDENFTHSEV